MVRSLSYIALLLYLPFHRCRAGSEAVIRFSECAYTSEDDGSVYVTVVGDSISEDVHVFINTTYTGDGNLSISLQKFTLSPSSPANTSTLTLSLSPPPTFTVVFNITLYYELGVGSGSGDMLLPEIDILTDTALVTFTPQDTVIASSSVTMTSSEVVMTSSDIVLMPFTTTSLEMTSQMEPSMSSLQTGAFLTPSASLVSDITSSLLTTSPVPHSTTLSFPPSSRAPVPMSTVQTSDVPVSMPTPEISGASISTSLVGTATTESSFTPIDRATTVVPTDRAVISSAFTSSLHTPSLSTHPPLTPSPPPSLSSPPSLDSSAPVTTTSPLVFTTPTPTVTTSHLPSSLSTTTSSTPIATPTPSGESRPEPGSSNGNTPVTAIVMAIVIIFLIVLIAIVAVIIAVLLVRKRRRTHTYYTAGPGNKFNHYIDVQVHTEEEMREKTPDSKDIPLFETSFVGNGNQGSTTVLNDAYGTLSFKGELAAKLKARSQSSQLDAVPGSEQNGNGTRGNGNHRAREE